MKEDLKKKAEELEETLQAQLNLIKSDSQDWLKVGSGILAGGLLAFGLVKLIKGKKESKNKKILSVLEKEGLLDDDIVAKLNAKKQSGFVGRMAAILLPMAIGYGREQLIKGYFSSSEEVKSEDEE
ncbi:hypothetical protein Belba_1057 [Belliella baltica DSM 15883]|uniref:Uncharacterized protein n=1 Tax=Belliella baltica (strain DSM 15883 / CIP 108006 / LMG 21964 / BA134) TaxID=866536 RepID=I3Z378_BELBD|nr:hypothetical protein [Belliella baltica]AFL83696.1 hypothetical protein Belba_1057 [Belliella baltica DSM 15883]